MQNGSVRRRKLFVLSCPRARHICATVLRRKCLRVAVTTAGMAHSRKGAGAVTVQHLCSSRQDPLWRPKEAKERAHEDRLDADSGVFADTQDVVSRPHEQHNI